MKAYVGPRTVGPYLTVKVQPAVLVSVGVGHHLVDVLLGQRLPGPMDDVTKLLTIDETVAISAHPNKTAYPGRLNAYCRKPYCSYCIYYILIIS